MRNEGAGLACFCHHERSMAWRFRSFRSQNASAPSWVARSTTLGGCPARNASCQRGAHRHQRSPSFNPAKPNSGRGVERSLPRDFENSRNSSVITTHTVWLPTSCGLVLQQPSRKKPVIGATEQDSRVPPNTLRGGCCPRPLPPYS